jgi:hypothetical protein
MAKTQIKFNAAGFEAIRRSPAAVSLLESKVDAAAAAAGPGYVGSVVQGVGRGTLGRAIGTVYTDTFKAILDNSRNQTLLRVFDRLGG